MARLAMRKPAPAPSLDSTGRREAVLPGPAFRPCPCCAVLVLYRIWHHGTKTQRAWWEELAVPKTFAGEAHACSAESTQSVSVPEISVSGYTETS